MCGQWAPASHTRTHARTPTNNPAQPHQPATRIRQHTQTLTSTRLYRGDDRARARETGRQITQRHAGLNAGVAAIWARAGTRERKRGGSASENVEAARRARSGEWRAGRRETCQGLLDDDACVRHPGERVLVAVVGHDGHLCLSLLAALAQRDGRARVQERLGQREGRQDSKHCCACTLCQLLKLPPPGETRTSSRSQPLVSTPPCALLIQPVR